jgi:short-subunit dehydrogenase
MTYRSAFITGASSGIGAQLARRLAARGTCVALAARRKERLEALVEEIERAGGIAHAYPLDVTDPIQTTEVIQAADDALGGLDLVVANAGIGRSRKAKDLTWRDCKPVINVNVVGAVATLVAVLPRMVERGRGHVVGMSSIAKYRAFGRNANYAASKAFLSTFLESLRIDLRGSGVHVSDIRPGYIETPLTADIPNKPFVLELDDATDRILDAIDKRKRTFTFPFPIAVFGQAMEMMPTPLWEALVAGKHHR